MNARIALLCACAAFAPLSHAEPPPRVEKIVFLRHGEKPDHEIGNLKCQGLNRALALPDVLIKKFGRADFIFAPGTTEKTTDGSNDYSYIRPLITIAPTAIRLGLPINADFGYRDPLGLVRELEKDRYAGSLIFVAWEHHMIEAIVKQLEGDFGGADPVPKWAKDDFDGLYVVTVTTDGAKRGVKLTFEHEEITPAEDCPDEKK